MVGQKVSIVSRKRQTTLARTLGIAIHGNSQIIFIDTPGFLRNKSAESLERAAWNAFRESEIILFLVDVSRKNLDASISLLKKIDEHKTVSLVMNKVDLVHKPQLLELAALFGGVRKFENVFMTSALTGNGVADILKYLDSIMPPGEWLYEDDQITDSSLEKYASEITREHIYHRLHQEIPYRCVVETESSCEQPDGSLKIVQNIHIRDKAHKSIIIGRGGGKIKAIGKAAREELCRLLERNVHLFLQVKIDESKPPLFSTDSLGKN
jgi:GTP-binding protein Era